MQNKTCNKDQSVRHKLDKNTADLIHSKIFRVNIPGKHKMNGKGSNRNGMQSRLLHNIFFTK